MSLLSPSLRALLLMTVLTGLALYVCPVRTPGRVSSSAFSAQRGKGLRTKLPTKPVAEFPAKSKRWALVIGVDVYVSDDIGNLRGAANDAEYLAKSLVQYAGFPEDQVIVLDSKQHPSKQPTRSNIFLSLKNLRASVPPDGLLLMAFSGHGVGQGDNAYLLPSDSGSPEDVAILRETSLSVGVIKELIKETGVKQVIFIIDSCRNDPTKSKGVGDNLMTAAFSRSFNFSLRDDNMTAFAILYAASVGQRAYEYAEKGQGYFTWTLIEGIKGGAANARGEVTLQNLIWYLESRVPKLVRRDRGVLQVPNTIVEGYMAGNLVVSFAKRPSSEAGDTGEDAEAPFTPDEATVATPRVPSGGSRLAAHAKSAELSPGQSVQLSFLLTNTGEKEEQFRVETDLPADYQPTFSAVPGATAGAAGFVTLKLRRGASLNLLLNVRAPEASTDGQQRRFYVTAVPQSQPDVMMAAVTTLTVRTPPALAAVSGVNTQTVSSGKEVVQTITVSNGGGTMARGARVEFVLQKGFEYVGANPKPLQYDPASRTVTWQLGDLEGHAERKIVLTARADADAPASLVPLGSGVLRASGPQPAVPFAGANIVIERTARETTPDFKHMPDLRLALRRSVLAAQPGQTLQLPLVITNTGNKDDQFRLETDLPAEYQPSFSQSGNDVGLPVFVTPQLSPGSSIEVILNARVPVNAPDNQQQRFLVRAASQADATVTKVTDVSLTVAAAALAASSNVTQESVQPGDTFTQRISVRNAGSAVARQTRADFFFGLDFELVSATPSPISYDRPSRTAIWSLGDLESRDSREITVTLRAVSESLAGSNKPVGRGIIRTSSLFVPSNFDGPAISVGRVAGARIGAVSKGLTATPGDTMYVPFIVRNPSNYPESFELRVVAPGAPQATIYADLNGDGRHQTNEPAVTQTATLDPQRGEYGLLLRVEIPRTTPDRTQFAYNLVARAMKASGRIASEDLTVLTVATPRVRVRFELISTRHASFTNSLGPLFMKPISWQQDDTPSQAEQDTFNRGRALFAKRQYEQAAAVFRDFLKDHPDSFIADLMLLWLGRSYIELGKFPEATQVAQRLSKIKDTPFSETLETELKTAKAEAASRRTTPQPSPTPGTRNSGTPELPVRGGGDAERPRTRASGRGETDQADARTKPLNSGTQEGATPGESTLGPAVPGDTVFYRLVLVNDGGGTAKHLSLTEQLPDAVEFISSSPELTLQDIGGGGTPGLIWRVAELAPGDTVVLQIAVRLRPSLAFGAVVKARHILTYQDSNSNAYRGQ